MDVFGPFDGAPWAQAQWYRDAYARSASGVYGPPAASVGAGDLPLTVNGLTVSVGLGRGHVRGAGYERTETPWSNTVDANTNTTLSRIDRLVLRRDLAAKTVTPLRLQGTPASQPAPPTLQQVENGQWDQPLFRFRVQPNSSTVLTDVVDERAWIDPATGARANRAPAWAPLPPTTPVVAGGDGVTYLVQPGRVDFQFHFVYSGLWTAGFRVVRFPEGARPTRKHWFDALVFNPDQRIAFEVSSDGYLVNSREFTTGTNGGFVVSGGFPTY